MRPRIGFARHDLGVLAMALALCVAGLVATQYKFSLVRDDRDIGHADEAAYVHMANSLAHGRGLDVNYISFFFIPYSREITRREDHWPPFLSLTIAPFLALFGNEPRVARIAPILIGSFGLPLMTAWLGLRYSRRTYVGLLAGLLMLANSAMFNDSMRTMSDVAAATLVTGLCAALLASQERPWAHIATGLFAAAGFYAKGSLLMLIPLYPALAVLVSGRRVIRNRWLHAGIAAAVVCVSPWLISNYRLFGNPFHSTQNYVSSFFGVEAFVPAIYKPYWGHDLPKVSDRWKENSPKFKRLLGMNREQLTRWAVLGPSTSVEAWRDLGPAGVRARWLLLGSPQPEGQAHPRGRSVGRWEEPITTLCGVAAVLFVMMLLSGAIVRASFARYRRRRRVRTPEVLPGNGLKPASWLESSTTPHGPPLLGATLALLLVILPQWVFITFMWKAIPRFSYPFLPLLAVIGCTGVGRVIELPLNILRPRRNRDRDWGVTAVLSISVMLALAVDGKGLKSLTAPHEDADAVAIDRQVLRLSYPEIGEWIARNLPRAVIMARNPWELLYSAGPGNKAVSMPFSSPDDIFSVARYYRVTHYLRDDERRGMDIFVGGNHPGMRPVAGAPGPLFELDYQWLPDSGLTGATAP